MFVVVYYIVFAMRNESTMINCKKNLDIVFRGYFVNILQKLTGYRQIPCQE